MRLPLYALLTLALATLGSAAANAQQYTYSNIRKDFVYDDGFGIPHSKTVSKQGDVRILPDEVSIDGEVYRKNEKGVYKNAKGRSVDLAFDYKDRKLVAVRIATGHIVNNYLLDDPAQQGVVVQR